MLLISDVVAIIYTNLKNISTFNHNHNHNKQLI